MKEILGSLYGDKIGQTTYQQLQSLLAGYKARLPLPQRTDLNEQDAMLITYPDQVQKSGEKPLNTLSGFCSQYLRDVIRCIHILPFYPYSSDDGFSVIDYKEVNPDFGDWSSIEKFGTVFRLMFDGIINHSSIQHRWFQSFLMDDEKHKDYYIVVDDTSAAFLSKVVRPRALPLLTNFQTPSGIKPVWTTFSADQVDLNFANPDVLLDIIDVLLFYASKGAEFIRLDAIAYLWKEFDTACINLPQTHAVVRLIRRVFDVIAPFVKLITETNVPHQDNISYFGNGKNEAQLVYNFSLPPLTLHAIHSQRSDYLSNWADNLHLPSDQVTFFNFLASHDGIGINPARGILSEDQILELTETAVKHDGFVSYKTNSDGSKSPYEININYFDALSNPHDTESQSIQVNRFMCSQAIMLSLRGMPGIYFHSLFGSRNWRVGALQSGHNRAINRQKLNQFELESELADEKSLRSQVFRRYCQLLYARASSSAFHPFGSQKVMDYGKYIFAIERTSPDRKQKVCCLHNISNISVDVRVPKSVSIFNDKINYASCETVSLSPYQVLWVNSIEG